jgi:hypothetical protein
MTTSYSPIENWVSFMGLLWRRVHEISGFSSGIILDSCTAATTSFLDHLVGVYEQGGWEVM